MWDIDSSNRMRHGNRVLLQTGGTGLGCFPAPSLHRFCYDLCTKVWFKCSRNDLRFDDYEKIIRPDEVANFPTKVAIRDSGMQWVEISVTPALEKIRQAIGDDRYYEWLQKRMESVELRKKAQDQITTYHRVHGSPMSSVPF
jgi:hypothetical protein